MMDTITQKSKELPREAVKKSFKDRKTQPITSDDMLFLSELYRMGAGDQPKDLDAARKWLMKAADMNNCTAMEMLGMDYLNGNEMYDHDTKAALLWFEKAAEHGSSDAQVFLGLAHLLEIGVSFQPMTAMFWLKKAAERGNTDAQEILSTFYEIDGDNKTKVNYEKLKKTTEHKNNA